MDGLSRLEWMLAEATPIPMTVEKMDAFDPLSHGGGWGACLHAEDGSTPVYCSAPEGIDEAHALAALRNAAPELIQVARAAEGCIGWVDNMGAGDALARALSALAWKLDGLPEERP